MSYVRPKRPPKHRPYREKLALIREWNLIAGGDVTLVAFCQSHHLALSTFEKWLTIQDEIKRVPAHQMNKKHVVARSSLLKPSSTKRVDPRRQALLDWMSTASEPLDMAQMRTKVSELWPQWDDIDHPEFKNSNYFAKWCRRFAKRFFEEKLERARVPRNPIVELYKNLEKRAADAAHGSVEDDLSDRADNLADTDTDDDVPQSGTVDSPSDSSDDVPRPDTVDPPSASSESESDTNHDKIPPSRTRVPGRRRLAFENAVRRPTAHKTLVSEDDFMDDDAFETWMKSTKHILESPSEAPTTGPRTSNATALAPKSTSATQSVPETQSSPDSPIPPVLNATSTTPTLDGPHSRDVSSHGKSCPSASTTSPQHAGGSSSDSDFESYFQLTTGPIARAADVAAKRQEKTPSSKQKTKRVPPSQTSPDSPKSSAANATSATATLDGPHRRAANSQGKKCPSASTKSPQQAGGSSSDSDFESYFQLTTGPIATADDVAAKRKGTTPSSKQKTKRAPATEMSPGSPKPPAANATSATTALDGLHNLDATSHGKGCPSLSTKSPQVAGARVSNVTAKRKEKASSSTQTPDGPPRKTVRQEEVIVILDSDESGSDIKDELPTASPAELAQAYTHVEACFHGPSLAPRLARSSRGKQFLSGVHNSHCGRCSRDYPCTELRLCDNIITYTECAPNRCSAMEFCQNQAIRKQAYPKTTVVKDPVLGFALRLDEDVRSQTKIVEYVGEYISNDEYLRRKEKKFGTADWYMARVFPKGDLHIDAGRKGNTSRFINHSCVPNCRLEPWYVDTKPRLVVVSNHALVRGTVLSLSYMDATWNIPCVCGACDSNYWIERD